MIDLTVPETGLNSTSSLWEEPYFPALTSSGIALPPCSPGPPLAGAQLTGRKGKKRKVKVKNAEFLTMTKFFFKNYRLTMYSHLNDLRRNGRLKHLVGFDFQTQVINRQALEIMNPTYWKITREMFEADVLFDLTLQTEYGPRTWHGCFVFYFWVEDSGIHGTIEDCCAVEDIPDHTDQQMLSPFLVPYQKGWVIDREGEKLWKRHYDGTVPNEDDRNALDLAKRMGLTIRYEAVDKDDGVGSILFFKEGRLLVKERNAPAKEKPKEVTIPAKTIVINTNIIKKEYSWFDIYHECYHYETHYAFYVLQQMGCNDLREMDDLVIEVDEEEKVSNPIYWIETQANRGAYALKMPVTEMRELTRQELAKVQNPKHRGDLYQQAGESIARILHKPHFRIRARLIQLGHIHARGALNYVDGTPIEPFDFDDEAWKEDNCTFVIDRYHSGKIYAKNKDYQALLDTGKFVYADGHIVRNAPEYVTWDKERHILTPWAYRNIDQCCLRFMKEYKLKNIGRYIRGRLNYDAAYATQMEFYMRDIINQKQLELDEAKQEYIRTFPETFHDAFTMLRQQNNVSMEDAEELFRVSQSTLNRWLDNPEEKISIDFIMFISLTWKLPDFITDLLFELAHKSLSMRDPRHVLFRHILRVEWEDGVAKANEHLKSRGMKPITI